MFQMDTPATARFATPSSDSVFQSLEDSLDDVFYEEPMPTSAVVTAADELPPLRYRHIRGNPTHNPHSESLSPSHPLSAAYYEMPSANDDRCTQSLIHSILWPCGSLLHVATCVTQNSSVRLCWAGPRCLADDVCLVTEGCVGNLDRCTTGRLLLHAHGTLICDRSFAAADVRHWKNVPLALRTQDPTCWKYFDLTRSLFVILFHRNFSTNLTRKTSR